MLCVLWCIYTKMNRACDVNTSLLHHSVLPFKLLFSGRLTANQKFCHPSMQIRSLCCVRWGICTKRYWASLIFVLVDLSMRRENRSVSVFPGKLVPKQVHAIMYRFSQVTFITCLKDVSNSRGPKEITEMYLCAT